MALKFDHFEDSNSWLDKIDIKQLYIKFKENGYSIVEKFIPEVELLKIYQDSVSKMHSGEIDVKNWRHDLGSHQKATYKNVENTGQIMWPSDRIEGLANSPLHKRGLKLSRSLLGHDLDFDFDMLIYKDAFTGGKHVNKKINCLPGQQGETPWHQDESYWPSGMTKIEDNSIHAKFFPGRSITIWLALDDVDELNGCLWFLPGSHKKKLRKHRTASKNSHVLTTDELDEIQKGLAHPVPLKKGDAVFWTGRTLHYANGNYTENLRRTYIVNYRPRKSIEYERSNGFDHLKNGFKNFNPSETAGDVYKDVNVEYKFDNQGF